MPRRCIRRKKILQVRAHFPDQCATAGAELKTRAGRLQHDLQQIMRRFGRQCRGKGKVFVTVGRQTEKQLLEGGQPLLPLVRTAQEHLHDATPLADGPRERLATTLQVALEAHHQIARQSRRLTQGKPLTQCKIVNAYDPTLAPIGKGNSNCPTQLGRKPGIIAEPGTGFIFAVHLPVGNPGDSSYVLPLIDKVQDASAQVSGRPTLASHSLAGDLAFNDMALRAALHGRGILTVGIPHTVEPLTPSATPEDILRILHEAGLSRKRTPHQVHIACACGYSRPVVESIIASLLCRGAARIPDKGHRGAIVHTGMAVLAHNAATLVRVHQQRLSKRAQKLRRLLRLRCGNVKQFNALKN